ncbi:MAG TPA: DUF2142 domain-containing protein [Thermoanaerobaculia bacterium]|nr:DUF2142 domain-containing protein [Thermoanaerobaculia bacterium]
MQPAPQAAAIRPSRAAAFFLAASLISGLVHMALTPPFQAPDEAAHFFRAWRVSEGHLDLRPGRGRNFVEVPAGLVRAGAALYGAQPFRAERPIAFAELRAATRVPLGAQRERVYVPNTLQYTFVPYVPQAAGIAVARLAGASALGLLYAARLGNLVVASLLIWLAVRKLPAYRWLTAALALTPMAEALRASASADAMALATACLLVALAADAAWGDEAPPHRRTLLALLGVAALLCTTKAAYTPLALLVLLVPRERWAGRRWRWLAAEALVVTAATAWALATARAVPALRVDAAVDPPGQVAHAIANPLAFAGIVARDYFVHAPRYAAQLVGKLGWLDVPLPRAFLVVSLLVLLALVLHDGSRTIELRPWHRLLIGATAAACLVLVSASQYALWTALGASTVEGVQGRHLLPIAVGGIWALHTRRWALDRERLAATIAIGWSALALIVAARALATHYFV